MEGVHGVDTSWLHHSKGPRAPTTPPAMTNEDKSSATVPPTQQKDLTGQGNHGHFPTRPHLHGRKSSEKAAGSQPEVQTAKATKDIRPTPSPGLSRKSSWLSSLSSKLTSSSGGPQHQQLQNGAQSEKPTAKAASSSQPTSPGAVKDDKLKDTPFVSSSPKSNTSSSGGGFLSNALRRFSSSSGAAMSAKSAPNGGICARRVMNVDPYRERCKIPDLEPAKLRRVAFCVDVEIAAPPKYTEADPDEGPDMPLTPMAPMSPLAGMTRRRAGSASEKDRKNKDKSTVKTKDRGEGEALKYPRVMTEKKEKLSRNRAGSQDDMFEIPDVDEEAPVTGKPGKPATAAIKEAEANGAKKNGAKTARSPLRHNDFGANGMFEVDDFEEDATVKESRMKKTTRRASSGGTSVHPDFGKGGMFEIDEFDEDASIKEAKVTTPRRQGSTGGSQHHDFGRNGMFEIPSSSEDEQPTVTPSEPGSTSNGPIESGSQIASNIASKLEGIPPGQVFSQELMLEVSDIDGVPANITNVAEAASQPSKTARGLALVEQDDTPPQRQPESNPAGIEKQSEELSQTEPGRKEITRKKEKKKRSEEERKERKEKKRQAAIANGTLPVELRGDDNSSSVRQPETKGPSKPHHRPTTDPLRIYKRCCQLRETEPLPMVVNQLSNSAVCDPVNTAIVLSLDLSGESLSLHDVVTLGDWLAVVPVQKLMLEGCGLTDEAVRVVLAGLLAVKTSEQARHNRHLVKKGSNGKKEKLGVISKLSLKNNPIIGRHGWMHIAFFIHMSRTLKAIDLSSIPFPKPVPLTVVTAQDQSSSPKNSTDSIPSDPFDVFVNCISERLGEEALDEVVIGDCDLSTDRIDKLVDAVITSRATRLGLANNNITTRGYQAVARYIRSGNCLGLDLGGNDLSSQEDLQIVLDAIDFTSNQMYALSLADSNIAPPLLKPIFTTLTRLSNFRFIDLSHNRKLFTTQPNALGNLRRYLPQLRKLKRIHLNDVGLEAEHAIALAEICPEIPELAHLSILENPALGALASAKDEASQEEACALYASLLAAARVSNTIVCIDIDVPSKDNSEVVKALARQVVAYSLRNMERSEAYQPAAAVIAEPHGGEAAVTVPDVLLHLVGHTEGAGDRSEDGPPAPDQDYLVGGTGVVKALSIVLGNNSKDLNRRMSRDVTPAGSGVNTPRLDPVTTGRAKDMSKNLLDSARKIRHRLQPALVRARTESSPDSHQYRRLSYLDTTLERIIQRFEDEYPECRSPRPRADTTVSQLSNLSTTPTEQDPSSSFTHPFESTKASITSPEALHAKYDEEEEEDDEEGSLSRYLRRSSRHGSDVSLASRQLVNEEAAFHRFGQRMRRDLLPPTYTFDHHWGTTGSGAEPQYLAELRTRLEAMSGEEIKAEVQSKGLEQAMRELNASAEALRELARGDQGLWEKVRGAGMAGEDETVTDEASDRGEMNGGASDEAGLKMS